MSRAFHDDEPRGGGGLAILGLLLALGATAGAYLVTGAEASRPRVSVSVMEPRAGIERVAPDADRGLERLQASQPTESRQTSATTATLQCNVSRCAGSYRSFREDDCSFQPYEGPRKLCEL